MVLGKIAYLVAFESADALASWLRARDHARWSSQFPHLDGLVQTTADKFVASRSKRDRVDTVLVAKLTLQADDKLASIGIPDSDTLVERSSGNIAIVWGNGDGCNAVFDAEVQHLLIRLEIPETDSPISTTGRDNAPVTRKIERVDVLLVSRERVFDRAALNVPDLLLSVIYH